RSSRSASDPGKSDRKPPIDRYSSGVGPPEPDILRRVQEWQRVAEAARRNSGIYRRACFPRARLVTAPHSVRALKFGLTWAAIAEAGPRKGSPRSSRGQMATQTAIGRER